MWEKEPASRRITTGTKEHLEVSIALAATAPEHPGECPSGEWLSALAEGRLHGAEREAGLAHVDGCPNCYRAWLLAARAAEEQPSYSRLKSFFTHRKRISLGLGLPLAAGLFLMLWLSQPPSISASLENAYRLAAIKLAHKDETAWRKLMPLPWEQISYGMSGSTSTTARQKALRQGMEEGREALAGKPLSTPDVERPWLLYHQLGQWLALARGMCLQEATPPPELWEEVRLISEDLAEDFGQLSPEDGEALAVQAAVKDIALAGEQTSCRQLQNATESILERW